MSDEAVTSLEMTSPAELRPGREAPEPITLGKVDPCAPQLLHETYLRVWEALPAGGRMHWSDAAWTEELKRPRIDAWLARIGREVAGLVELEADRSGVVGIVVFGLVPEFRGRGVGGAFLTLVTRLAWDLPQARPVRRVWLQTSSGDHPNALANYLARGFKVFRTDAKHN